MFDVKPTNQCNLIFSGFKVESPKDIENPSVISLEKSKENHEVNDIKRMLRGNDLRTNYAAANKFAKPNVNYCHTW